MKSLFAWASCARMSSAITPAAKKKKKAVTM
jgi:hypothetical protein